ncbi:MAG: type II toxin-antitoxin system Phd/YefM family antitoxin [Oscillatoria princeps RMCB-10]|jgi:prevent-host-death family protein|nr:type II toxin-antitoxin system Phd/YefM family antitoxin [Oscillatoria princeps RMCB-10]
MYHVTADYAKNNFDEVFERAETETGGVVIVKGNKSFILISQEEFDAWGETAELLQDPNLLSDIKEARAQYKNGEALTMAQVFG